MQVCAQDAAGWRDASFREPSGDEGIDALDRFRGDAAAEPKARHQLAVVDYASSEGALGHADALAERRDLGQKLVVGRTASARGKRSVSLRVLHGDCLAAAI